MGKMTTNPRPDYDWSQDEVATLAAGGMKPKMISRQLRLSVHVVNRRIARARCNGAPIPSFAKGPRVMGTDISQRIADMYRAGKTQAEISRELDISKHTVQRVVKTARYLGIDIPSSNSALIKIDRDIVRKITPIADSRGITPEKMIEKLVRIISDEEVLMNNLLDEVPS